MLDSSYVMFRVAFALALAASGLLAQAPTPGRLVRLYPVALDANGQPVADLTADDFKIADQNKPETILFFHKPGHEQSAPADVLTFSNRTAGATPHTTVMLFDMINMVRGDRLENAKALDKAIPQIESGEHLYFYLLNLEGVLVPIHPIGPPAGDDKAWPQNVAAVLDKAMKANSHVEGAQIGAEEQQKRTFKALEDLANKLAPFPGRKDIVWIANGLTTVSDPKLVGCNGDWVECALYVPHLAVTLAGDGVAVDPYALIGNLNGDANYNLDQMALLTGGHFYSRQDVGAVIKQVAGGAAGSYAVFYDPGPENWNNQWHRVHLTCERKGVKLQIRDRYYAVTDSRSPIDRMKAALSEAFGSPADFGEIGVSVKISPLDGKPGMHLEIRIDPSDLLLREQGGKYSGALLCLISDRSAAGPLGEPSILDLKPELTADQYKMVLKNGIPLPQDHPTSVPQIRVIILDQNTNQVGSVTFPIK
jgi:VWFA-related protein